MGRLEAGFEGVRVTELRPAPDVDFDETEKASIHDGAPLDADPSDSDGVTLEVGREVPLSPDLSDRLEAYDPLPRNPQE